MTVPKEVQAATTTVTVTGPGEGKVAYGHLQVRAEQFAEAVVVIDHRGSGTVADNVEILVGDGAKLTVVSVHDWADDAVQVVLAPREARPGRAGSSTTSWRWAATWSGSARPWSTTAPAATPS